MRLLFHEPRKGGCQNAFSLPGTMCTAGVQWNNQGICSQAGLHSSPLPNPCFVTLSKFLQLSSLDCSEPLRDFNEIMQPAQHMPLTARNLGWAGTSAFLLSWLSLPLSVMTWPCSPPHLPLTQPSLHLLQVSMLGSRLFKLEDFG